MSYLKCMSDLSLGDKIPDNELRETAADYVKDHGMAIDKAMLRAVTEKLAMSHMEERRIVHAVRGAYEAAGGPKREVPKPAEQVYYDPAKESPTSKRFTEDNRLSNLSMDGASWERIRSSNPDLAHVKNANEKVTIYRATIGDSIRPDDFVAVNRAVAEMELESVKDRDGGGKIIEQRVKVGDLLMGNDATEFVYFPKGGGAAKPNALASAKKSVSPEQSKAYADALAAGNKRQALRVLHETMGIEDKDATIDRGGAHSPSGPEDGSPLYDVTRSGTYPEDIYSQNGLKYYGTGEERMDAEAYRLIRHFDAHPNMPITVYRAVHTSESGKINPGDWVTMVRDYAKDHGEGALNGDYKIIKKLVKARDIFTSGDSWLEWGYHPQEFKPEILKGTNKDMSLEKRVNPDHNESDDASTADLFDRASREEIRDAAMNRAVSASIARRQGLEDDPIRRTSALLKLRQAFDKLESGREGEGGKDKFVARVESLLERLEQKTAVKSADSLMAERLRGPDIIREKLLAAKRRGELSPETADMADWFIRKNPALVDELGLSVKSFKGDGNAPAGQYNPAARVMTLFKGSANDTTGVHEILHHMERLMPADMQRAIRSEYLTRIGKLMDDKATTPATKEYLQSALKAFATGEARDQKMAGDLLAKAPRDAYQYFNPSEFWAVNATRLMERRYESQGSVWSRIHNWMSDAVQKVMGAVGLRSDAPVLRALDAVMSGKSGEIANGSRMLSDARELDQPAYHGSPHKFDKFTLDHMGSGEGAQAYGHGLYFAGEKKVAEYYRVALSNEDSKGAMYTVEIPENHQYLNLDKKLSDQPDSVKAALNAIGEKLSSVGEVNRHSASRGLSPQMQLLRAVARADDWQTGHWAYDFISKHLTQDGRGSDPAGASKMLNEHGVPGAMYADAMSRGKDNQSHNYVIYDDAHVDIKGRDYNDPSDTRELNEPGDSRTIEVDGVRRPVENSDGRQIAGDAESQKAFWKWFGDSKAVDADGRPMAMFHGTDKDFESFDKSLVKSRFPYSFGLHFTDRAQEASIYADSITNGAENFNYGSKFAKPIRDGAVVLPVYVAAKNPLMIETKQGSASMEADGNRAEIIAQLVDAQRAGRPYDAVIIRRNKGDEYDGINVIVFKPEQVKSATGNRGTFDANDPSILYDRTPPEEPAEPKSYKGPGSELLHATTNAADGLLNNLLENVSPMTLGSDRSRAIVFDFAAARRKAQFLWGKMDDNLTKNFTAEDRKAMWEAANEQNELLIKGESTAGKGIDTLPADQRAAIDYMSNYGNVLLEHAREIGMFKGEGVPYWTPRMAVRIAASGETSRVEGGWPKDIGGKSGIATTASSLKARQHEFLTDSEAALKMKLGDDASYLRDIRTMPLAMEALERAIAGRTLINKIKAAGREAGEDLVATGKGTDPEFFTIKDNPAFYTSEPRMLKDSAGHPILTEAGKVQMVKDQSGNLVMDRVPIYIRKEFQGPLEAVMVQKHGDIYKALMGIKGAAMSAIMWTPFTHMMTEIGRAAPLLRTRLLPVWFVGNKAKNDIAQMGRAIDAGLVPIGGGHGFSDITGMVGDADLAPGRSWATRQVGNAIGTVNYSAGEGFKKGADAFGKFWHDKLLWDRIGDLQMGIYTYMRGDLMKKGVSEQAASVQAAHFANRYAGAIKPESVPGMTGKILNVLMFSRSFTLGNLGAMKDCLTGLPSDVKSKILMDAMSARLALGQDKAQATAGASKELGKAVSGSRAKSIEAMAVDLAVMVGVTSLAQSAMSSIRGLNPDEDSFLDRLRSLKDKAIKSPVSVVNHPLDALWSLSSSHTNEPGKEGRILIGYDKDGTAEYARLAFGKIGEEVEGYLSHPVDKLKSKMSTLAKPMLETVTDDKGFGRPLFDPDAKGGKGAIVHIGNFATNLAKAQVPADTIAAAYDWTRGNANEVDKLKIGMSLFGIPVSKGATGGPEVGVVRDQEKRIRDSKAFNAPLINRALKSGDEDKAREIMDEMGMTPHEQNMKINNFGKVHQGPTSSQRKSFNKHATDDEQEKMATVR